MGHDTPDTLWIGRVTVPGDPRQHCVRVATDGRAPQADDQVEEICDPFVAAHPATGGGPSAHAHQLASDAAPVAGGLACPLGELELAAPVRPGKIICIGRNYRAHAQEMGNEVPAEPLLFFKPTSALLGSGRPLPLPQGYERLDMEAELVAVVGQVTKNASQTEALSCIAGYTLGNDVSCRDLQRRDKQWTRAKGFDGFAPLGPFVRLTAPGEALDPNVRIQGYVDDEITQDAPISAMVFGLPVLIEYITACMSLEPGDVIYTGTPKGVAQLHPGHTCAVQLQGLELGRLQTPLVVAN